jgi:hypothetical protein
MLAAAVLLAAGPALTMWQYGFFRVSSLPVTTSEPVAHLLRDVNAHNIAVASSHAAYLVRATHPSGGRLYYFGSRHTNDPADPQIAEIKRAWAEFDASIALVESRMGLAAGGVERGVRTFGEPGAVYALARDEGVAVHSLEPFADEHARALADSTDPEAAAAYLALLFADSNANAPYSDADIEEALRKRAVGVLANVIPDAQRFDALWQSRWYEEEGDWRVWEPSKHAVFDPQAFDHVGEVSVRIRDEHMVRLITQRVGAGERVFAVVGRSHVVVQEPALRALLPEAELTTEFLEHTWVDR